MRWLVAVTVGAAALALIAASMAMNWAFWAGQGADDFSSRLLGGVSIAVDVFKAVLPLVIAWAWTERHRLGLTIASLFFAGCLAFSFFSAIGFAAQARGAATGSKEALGLRYQAATKELQEIEGRVAGLASPRPQAVIDEAIAKARQDRRWSTSRECVEATAETSRTFCKEVGDLKIELASAVEAERLRNRLDALKREARTLLDQGARQEHDPQAGMLARLAGWGLERAQMSLIVFVALLVEIGAAFGLFLAALPLQGAKRPRDATTLVEVMPPDARLTHTARPTRFVRSADGQLLIE